LPIDIAGLLQDFVLVNVFLDVMKDKKIEIQADQDSIVDEERTKKNIDLTDLETI
jgi:hypothetical protein